MAEEKDAFYVVRKGDVVGIYKSFSDIQPLLASSSASGDSVSVYKGYSLSQKSEEYLASNGLKGAPYSISAANVHEGLFGRLTACPYQDPYSSGGRAFDVNSSSRNLQGAIQYDTSKATGSFLFPTNSQRHHALGVGGSQAELSTSLSCTLHFDGASKGNPGPAGAGAILRDGNKVYRLSEGVGRQTNNVAEYLGLILGLKQALKKGYKHILVQGDSLLVCNQMMGLWKLKNQNMASLCHEARELGNKFLSFKISHVPRESNSEADAQANIGVNLRAGEVREDCLLL